MAAGSGLDRKSDLGLAPAITSRQPASDAANIGQDLANSVCPYGSLHVCSALAHHGDRVRHRGDK
jgi:hypothetical protein